MAIIVLDLIVDVARAVWRAVTGRGPQPWLARAVLAATLAVLIATTAAVVLVLRTPERLAPVAIDPPPGVALPATSATARPGHATPAAVRPTTPGRPATTATNSAAPVTPPSPAGPPSTRPAPVDAPPLQAHFAVEESALLSYGAAVTISNPGPDRVTAWELVITLPRESLEVTSVRGARATRDGATWTFTPDGTAGEVPGAGWTRVTFRVSGAAISATPTACTIDGTACTGLRD